MKKVNLKPYVKTARNVITANSPILLVGTALAGVVATGYFAARGGYKARGIIDAAEAERAASVPPQAPLEMVEKAKLTWLCYTAPGVSALSSCLAIVGVHVIHTKRANAMAALYAVASGKLDTMTEEAEKLLGPKKNQDLANTIGQREVDGNPVSNNEVIMTGQGQELCYDVWSGRYFTANLGIIENAVHEVNMALVESGDCALNDFYEYVGLPSIPMGHEFGWSGEKINVTKGSVTTDDGRPALSVTFRPSPKPNLGRP